jgi:hypothetical protein
MEGLANASNKSQSFTNLVRSVILHQVGTGANVRRVGALGDELQLQRVAGGSDAVSARVVCTIYSTVGCTCLVVRAGSGVPLVTSVTVVVPSDPVSDAK